MGGYLKIDQNLYREVFSFCPAAVAIVTTSINSKPYGFTATSVTPVSLDPPLVLFCIDKRSGSHEFFYSCTYFAINFLTQNQKNLAVKFARRIKDKFADTNFTYKDENPPILPDAISSMLLRRSSNYDEGDHTIIVGQVIDANIYSLDNIEALGYYRRSFISSYHPSSNVNSDS
ncbi:MAG: flavin reductase family protein [Rickettsiaceae bacterium]|nr:flavin reductase family protein [Rickettsiaceae bacterium]